ncbi:hypothetical protein [Rubricoccus marinus]|uniref:Transporter n=1 Tax=Rubricoccus marinus TaxID=716817 RepID=A0A259U236_9BACT|nr:hypothetical protein [Rubricoccus marinus]OZC04113.1 hypothetical protein BSZ36_14655 [Rubricoccus marinus]
MLRSFLLLALAALASGASAQTPWRASADGPSVSLDIAYGSVTDILFTNDRGEALGEGRADSYVGILSARVPVGARGAIVGSLPVALYAVRFNDTVGSIGATQTSFDIGNPYVGFATRPLAGAEVEAGVWLPAATGGGVGFTPDVAAAGFSADRENFEAYKTDVVSARLALRGEADLSAAASVRGEIAPVLSYYTGDLPTDGFGQELDLPRTNAAVTGAVFTDLRFSALALTVGALGRYEPKGGTDRYFDELFASGLAMVTYEGASVQPSLGVRVPLAAISASDFVLTAGVSVPLR